LVVEDELLGLAAEFEDPSIAMSLGWLWWAPLVEIK